MWLRICYLLIGLCIWAIAMGGLIQFLIDRDSRDDWEDLDDEV